METVGKTDDWGGGFCWAVVVLLAGATAGVAVADWINTMPVEAMPSTGVRTSWASAERSGWELFWFILRRNLTVFVILLFGVVSAGSVTVVVLLGNGIAIGQLIGFAKGAGLSGTAIANLLLPHGVLELGTLCLAGAVGLRGFRLALGMPALDWALLKSLRLGLVLAFGLGSLAVAAAVESFVTAELAELLQGRS